jgi:hypothetical protein
LRKTAYRIPEHYTSHWLMLMLADRVDVIEHRPARLLALALPLLAGGMSVVALRRRRRRSSWLSHLIKR